MIVHINGYPGTGKLTIARHLMARIGARLLDNHSIYNVALALTAFKSPEYYKALRDIRNIAYGCARALPEGAPLILTNAHLQQSAWGNECWDAVIGLARDRGSALYTVVLACAAEEHDRRIADPARLALRKPVDPALFPGNRAGAALLDRGGDDLLHLDVTLLSAEAAAGRIADWLEGKPSSA